MYAIVSSVTIGNDYSDEVRIATRHDESELDLLASGRKHWKWAVNILSPSRASTTCIIKLSPVILKCHYISSRTKKSWNSTVTSSSIETCQNGGIENVDSQPTAKRYRGTVRLEFHCIEVRHCAGKRKVGGIRYEAWRNLMVQAIKQEMDLPASGHSYLWRLFPYLQFRSQFVYGQPNDENVHRGDQRQKVGSCNVKCSIRD